MMSEKLEQALNSQINAELYSSYLYLSMSSYFSAINLKGFAQWMRVQAQEELMHAMKMYDYAIERAGRIVLTPIDAPVKEWRSPLSAFEHVLQHEKKVTGLINDLVTLAKAEGDDSATVFLQWYVSEQVEEEESARKVVDRLKDVRGDADLRKEDVEMGKRKFSPPKK